MTPDILESAGLNKTQAKVYISLIENGAMTPSQISEKAIEKRTNTYMVLDQLERLDLVEKSVVKTKTYFEATNPISLEKLAESRRKQLHDAETKIKLAMPTLLNYYYSFTEKPGIRLFQGVEGLKDIYADTLRAKQDIYLLRTEADIPNMTEAYLDKYRQKRAQLKINTYALTPETPEAKVHFMSGEDDDMLFKRTFIPKGAYTAPVEIDIYGDRIAFAIFGDDIMGVIIDNKYLAEAIKQIFKLVTVKLSSESTSVK